MDYYKFPQNMYKGRVESSRHLGKIGFVDIQCCSELVQGVFKKDILGSKFPAKGLIGRGDVLCIRGYNLPSLKRETSLDITDYALLSKNHAGKDIENNNHGLQVRSDISSYIRTFLREEGFLEVDLPVLHTGKLSSKSKEFSTKHVTLGDDLYLRKSMDVFLRRLALRGLDKIYSIGPNFRNEHISKNKLPEFNMLALIENYSSVPDLISRSQRILDMISQRVPSNYNSAFETIPQVTYKEFVKEFKDCSNSYNLAKHNNKSPVFVYGFPSVLNSLAKDEQGVSEEFKLIVGGETVIHGYLEINDPMELKHKLSAQGWLGDGELEILLEEMNCGCPPAASMGLSMDRLSMIFSDAKDIRSVTAFPFSRLKR